MKTFKDYLKENVEISAVFKDKDTTQQVYYSYQKFVSGKSPTLLYLKAKDRNAARDLIDDIKANFGDQVKRIYIK